MHLRSIIIIALTLCFSSCASLLDLVHPQERDWHIQYHPPGTVWVSDSTFMDQAEMSNYGYQQFVEYIEFNYGKDSANTLLPDTSAWNDLATFYQRYNTSSESYVEFYHKLIRFWNFPIVGIDHHQASEYCQWRSVMVNKSIYGYIYEIHDAKLEAVPEEEVPIYIEYRLPSKEEWELAAFGGLSPEAFPLGHKKLIVGKNDPVTNTLESVNFKFMGSTEHYGFYDNPIIEQVFDGWPNEFYLYNMLGNVSELVSNDLVKGLNFTMTLNGMKTANFAACITNGGDFGANYTLATDYSFHAPSSLIGFRCAAIIHYSRLPMEFDFKRYMKSL